MFFPPSSPHGQRNKRRCEFIRAACLVWPGRGASGHLVLLPRILSPSNINQNALMLKRYQIGLVSDRQVIWRVTFDFAVYFAF
jgi:hypothetical protein